MDPKREFELGEWLVTPLRGVIHGPQGTRRITPKAMDVLLCLAQRPGEVVSREIFLAEVWDGRAYSDEPLNKCIAELRRNLGDSRGTPDYIETIPKRGYRLVASMVPVGDVETADTQTGIRSGVRAVAFAVLLALAAVGVWQLTSSVSHDGGATIAVLPFDDLSETGKAHFADSVHEELIGQLSRNDALIVRSRTSTLQYRDNARPLPEIARELDVDVIVEGTVRQDGDSIRVTAQIIEAGTDEHLWAGNIEKSLSVAGLFAIQEQIATEIAASLSVTLATDDAPTLAALPTDNIDAYDNFILGKYHYRRQLPDDIRIAVNSFEAAVRLDPGFADAWDWLAYAYNHAATGIGYLTPDDAYPKARSAALRALEIQPDLATAVSILGYIRAVYDRDWVGAEVDLQRAIDLNPNDSGTVWSLAHVYSLIGKHDDAVELTRNFAERFPAQGRNHREVAKRLIDAGRFDAALERLQMAAAANDEPAQVADDRGIALFGLGRFDEAAAAFEFAVDGKQREASTLARLAHVYGVLGKTREAEAMLTELEQRAATERISPMAFATVHAGLNDQARAIRYLDEAATRKGRDALSIPHDPFFAGVRSHAEFRNIVAALRLPAQ